MGGNYGLGRDGVCMGHEKIMMIELFRDFTFGGPGYKKLW